MKILWLDDARNPFLDLEGKVPKVKDSILEWVLNMNNLFSGLKKYGLPDIISFDHDLMSIILQNTFWSNYEENKKYQEWRSETYQEKTGMDCAKWLVDYCIDNDKELPEFYVQPIQLEQIT